MKPEYQPDARAGDWPRPSQELAGRLTPIGWRFGVRNAFPSADAGRTSGK